MASRSTSGTTKDRTDSGSRSTNSRASKNKPERSSNARAGKEAKTSKKAKASPRTKTWESRAVVRLIEAGSTAECPHCGERVKFRARHRDQQVICNVYVDGVWDRVEQYHAECYDAAGEPHGEPIKK